MIFKNLVLQALGTIWFRFLQKKYLKKFHACVPLRLKLELSWPLIHPQTQFYILHASLKVHKHEKLDPVFVH
jgi:hypothetical protein